MLSVIAMRRPEDEELGGRCEGDEFVDISQMQLLVEAGPSGLHYGGPPPPHAQPQPYVQPPAHVVTTTTASVDDLFALYFTPTSHADHVLGIINFSNPFLTYNEEIRSNILTIKAVLVLLLEYQHYLRILSIIWQIKLVRKSYCALGAFIQLTLV